MKLKSIHLLLILFATAFVVSGCAGGGGSLATSWPGLTADGDTAYMAYNQHVYAVNLENGVEKWRFPTETDRAITFYAAPSLTTDGQLLVGGYNNTLYSLDPTSGAEKWSYLDSEDRYIGSNLAADQGIFAPNADAYLYALDNQGKFRWNFATQGPLWAKPVTDTACTCIYLTSMDHRVYSIDAQTGRVNWQTDDLGGSMVGSPALSSDGVLYVGTFASEVIALNAENGEILWRIPTSDWVWGAPVLKDDRLYFGVLDGNFYAVDAGSGENLWGPFQADGTIPDSPLVTDEAIYFTTQTGSLYGFNLDGSPLLSPNPKILGGKLATGPVQAGELVLIAQTDANKVPVSLLALDINGNPKWTFTPETK